MNTWIRACAAATLCASSLSGCGNEPAPAEMPIFDTRDMRDHVACADTWIQLWDVDAEIAIEIYVGDMLDQLASSDGVVEFDLGDSSAATLSLVQASPIADNYCTDGLVVREVHSTWAATSGLLRVTEEATGADPTVTILLDEVVVSIDGEPHMLSPTERTEIEVLTAWGG